MTKPAKYIVVPVNKEMTQILRWVKLAASRDDDRPMLQCILFTPETWVATDGFRIHEANISGLPFNTFPTDGLHIVHSIHGGLVVLEKMETVVKFPDYQVVLNGALSRGILPTAEAKQYRVSLNVQAKIIVDALNFAGNMGGYNGNLVNTVEIGGGPLVIHVACSIPGVNLTACLMPMNIGASKHEILTVLLTPKGDPE